MVFLLFIRRIFLPKKCYLLFFFPLLVGFLFGTLLLSLNQQQYSRSLTRLNYFSLQKQQNNFNNKKLILVKILFKFYFSLCKSFEDFFI